MFGRRHEVAGSFDTCLGGGEPCLLDASRSARPASPGRHQVAQLASARVSSARLDGGIGGVDGRAPRARCGSRRGRVPRCNPGMSRGTQVATTDCQPSSPIASVEVAEPLRKETIVPELARPVEVTVPGGCHRSRRFDQRLLDPLHPTVDHPVEPERRQRLACHRTVVHEPDRWCEIERRHPIERTIQHFEVPRSCRRPWTRHVPARISD